MATETSPAQHVADLRQRYVSGAVATPPIVAASASGARIVDADGTSFIDFAGGLGCLNVGHGAAEVVAAIHAQADRYLHQCFMVAMYEPYVETCRRLAELSPCRGAGDHKSLLVNSGAEANENAVKVARAFTGRPAVIVFDRGFHGRTNLTMAMTTKVHPYKHGFGPLAGAVYRAPAPYPLRGVSTDDAIAGLHAIFKEDVDPGDVACLILEPVQGEGGFIPMPRDFPRRPDGDLRRARDPLRRRRGPGRHGPHRPGVGDRALRRAAGRPRVGQVARRRPAARGAPAFRERTDRLAATLRTRLDELAGRHPFVREVRGLGPMLALELDTRERAYGTTQAARERGLVLLSCGYDGNVIRILVPHVIEDADLEQGLRILDEALGAA